MTTVQEAIAWMHGEVVHRPAYWWDETRKAWERRGRACPFPVFAYNRAACADRYTPSSSLPYRDPTADTAIGHVRG